MSDATGHPSQELALLSTKVAELELELSRLAIQVRVLQLLRSVASCLSDDLELLPTLRCFRQAMGAFMPDADVAVAVANADGKLDLPLADEPLAHLSKTALTSTKGPFAEAMYQGRMVHIASTTTRELLPRWQEGLPELLVAPLMKAAAPAQGLLILARSDGNGFSPEEQEAVAAAGRELSSVLHKVSLFAQTRELSITDALTGLYNRRHLEERLQHEVARASRYCHPLTLLLIDIDHFKVYNDVNGHLEGDEALRGLAALLCRHTRQADLVARFGGEEFVVLLPEIDSVGGRAVAEKLRVTVAQTPFCGEEALPGGKLTISVGVATFPTDAEEPAALLDLADRGLYLSKRRGRNCVSHFLDEV